MSELGAASGHLVPEISGFTGLDCPRRGTHGPRLVTTTQGGQTLQKKIGRGTLDLELTLDSYSGAPRGPRASPERLLSLQRNVTNVLAQGSRSDVGYLF